MKLGQRSLLFGVHHIIWHPITVLIAWWKLYGRPTWPEFVCIIIHDWGYWYCDNMDGKEGERHPEFGARLALKWFGTAEYHLVLYHSRHYARNYGVEPSKLCWADKMSILYDPWWFYLPRAWLSGELFEYRVTAALAGFVSARSTHREWFRWVRDYLSKQAIENTKYQPKRCPDCHSKYVYYERIGDRFACEECGWETGEIK